MVAGILVGHRDFPQALLNAAESIMGKQDNFQIVSNEQCSADELKNRIENAIKILGNQDIIIFVDVLGGSCGIVSGGLVKQPREKQIAVFNYASLPILIKFFQYRSQYEFKALLELLEKSAKEGIKILT